MKINKAEYTDEFIEYCNASDWIIDGKFVQIKSYKPLIDEWIAKK